ncbi:MAG: SMC-Scp complex subunit ScpB [Acidimicrobiales bacterium]
MSSEAARAIEAVLMVATDPVDPHLLAQLLEVPPSEVAGLCEELADAYEAGGRGFVLKHVAGGYRFQSHPDLAAYVERFVLEGQSAHLSGAALETLAIVAYKQPLSRNQVAAIRGVNVDGVMRTLLQRGYVVEVGRDPGPGQATLFGTTAEFLERLGLATLDDLPAIAELFPSAEVMEALELGLRATPPDPPVGTPAPTDAPSGAVDAEGPEPVPPAWATDPEPPWSP